MLDLSRRAQLLVALSLFAICAVVGVVAAEGWLDVVDGLGRHAVALTARHAWLTRLLYWVELGSDWYVTLGCAVVLAVLLVRRYRRAAAYAVLVVLTALIVRRAVAELVGEGRPAWQLPHWMLDTPAYPSGHATGAAALAGVVMVIATMLVRRRGLRRALHVLIIVLVLVVAADRVFLGRHTPSDVAGGLALGAGFVFLGLALYTPLPASHALHRRPLIESVTRGDRRVAVVLNPIKVESVNQFQHTVTTMALESGWKTPTWYFTTVDDSGTGMAREAREAGADLVLVCGGDGTVREVCAELAGTGIAVGIIPGGTGNLLARNLRVPLYIRAAIDVALTGQDRAIDLVSVSGDNLDDGHFMVMAGMGFDAAIMSGVNEDIKKRIGWPAYVIAALKSMMFPAMKVELSVDSGPFTMHRARTVVVGNVGYLQANMPLLPEARIDDGRLDVVLLYPQSFWGWLPLAFRVLGKGQRTDDLVNRMTGRSVVVRTNHAAPRQLDGDPVSEGQELRMECLPGRLLVRVPR